MNIHLAVGPLGSDGFHQLRTVFHGLGIYDLVTATHTPGSPTSLRLSGPEQAGLPADDSNLAWRAALALAAISGRPPEVALAVQKAIPIAAGLAGGSADAAGALLACDALWGLDTPRSRLAELASGLGSDVAFALTGRTAVGTGRGERLRPVAGAALNWVVAAADGVLRTPDVYAELDRQRGAGRPGPSAGDPGLAVDAVASGDPQRVAEALANDLQPAALALAPYLGRTLKSGLELGALGGIVSGSGPTCVFIASGRDTAVRLAEGLQASGTCRFATAVIGDAATAIVQRGDQLWPTS